MQFGRLKIHKSLCLCFTMNENDWDSVHKQYFLHLYNKQQLTIEQIIVCSDLKLYIVKYSVNVIFHIEFSSWHEVQWTPEDIQASRKYTFDALLCHT